MCEMLPGAAKAKKQEVYRLWLPVGYHGASRGLMGCQLGGGRVLETVGGIPGGVVLGQTLSPQSLGIPPHSRP